MTPFFIIFSITSINCLKNSPHKFPEPKVTSSTLQKSKIFNLQSQRRKSTRKYSHIYSLEPVNAAQRIQKNKQTKIKLNIYLLLLSRSAVVCLGQIWFDMRKPTLKHSFYFQYNAEEASTGREGDKNCC